MNEHQESQPLILLLASSLLLTIENYDEDYAAIPRAPAKSLSKRDIHRCTDGETPLEFLVIPRHEQNLRCQDNAG